MRARHLLLLPILFLTGAASAATRIDLGRSLCRNRFLDRRNAAVHDGDVEHSLRSGAQLRAPDENVVAFHAGLL